VGPLVELRFTARPADPFHRCFGCGAGHPAGLHVRCFRAPGNGEGVVSPIVVPRQYEGPPGAAHGGIVAAYLDEVLGGAVAAAGRGSVTGELTVRYVRPTPTESPLLGRGRVVRDHGRYLDAEGSLERFPGGEVVALARGRFFPAAR
jgi:acyl-coenzyme A thioesterase PaaI-like protein